jgi:hypothetical protein
MLCRASEANGRLWAGYLLAATGRRYARAANRYSEGAMVMRRWVLGVVFSLVSGAGQAQVPAKTSPTSASPPSVVTRASPKTAAPLPLSDYCLAASAAFLESESKAFDELKKCARGDTIVIPAKSASAVARLCDFSKAIVATPDHVVCVIVTPERASK